LNSSHNEATLISTHGRVTCGLKSQCLTKSHKQFLPLYKLDHQLEHHSVNTIY